MTRREYDQTGLDLEQQDTINMVVDAELKTAALEDDLGVKSITDKYSNIRNIFGSLADRSEEGDEKYEVIISSMLHVDSAENTDWNDLSTEVLERINKLYVYGRILLRLQGGSSARVSTYMNTYVPQFKKTRLAMVQGEGLDLALFDTIREEESSI